MISGWKAKIRTAEPTPTTPRPRKQVAKFYRLVSWLFARKGVSEAIATRVHLNTGPEAVWDHIMLYEEIPENPPFLLRVFLPHPVRTEGDKTRVGATVRCVYREGDLVKRITSVEPPHLLEFEVIKQRLGIEGCTLTLAGSYQIHPCGDATDVVLITNYRAYLRPRFLWRPLEALLVGLLHKHILNGVSGAIPQPSYRLLGSPSRQQCAPLGGLACTILQSHSRR